MSLAWTPCLGHRALMGGGWGVSAPCDDLAALWGHQERVVPNLRVSCTAAREQGAPAPPCSVCFASLFGLFLIMDVTCRDPTQGAWGLNLCRIELCPPPEPVPVPAGALFSPCLKICTLLPCSGVLPGCCTVGVGRRSLLSRGERSPPQRLHGGSAPVCTVCLPTLRPWDGAEGQWSRC